MFNLKDKVRFTQKKIDGRQNEGIVVGILLLQGGYYLGYRSEEEFFRRFDNSVVRYTVAYIDCFTERACVEEVYQNDLESI